MDSGTTPPSPPAPDLPPFGAAAILRTLLRLALVLLAAWLLHLALGWVMTETETLAEGASLRAGMLMLLLGALALLIAVPFVPGVELGLSLLLVEGGWIAPLVYLATVAGLMVSFLAGQLLPYATLHRTLADIGLRRLCRLIEALQPLGRAERLALLGSRLPARIAPWLLRHRYVAVAALVNMPGNSVLGGGGGILLLCGLSRLFSAPATAATLLLAVAPVPLLAWIYDGQLPF
jgi:hypothetical protein